MNSLTYQKIIKAITALAILIVILIPGEIINLLIELLHIIWELLVELLHFLFESLEISLDTAIELLFETDLHSTQIIVFYIIMSVLSYIAYRLARRIPNVYRYFSRQFKIAWMHKKMCIQQYWYNLTWLDKLKVVAMVIGAIYIMIFMSF
jgi:hypothetical protein